MRAWLRTLLSSLGVRLLVPLFLTVGGVLAVHAIFSFSSIQEHFVGFVGGEAHRSSGLIRRATHDGMLLNRLGDVQAMIERLADGPEVAAIRVYDREGTIVLSSNRLEIGRSVPVDSVPCFSCHGPGEPLTTGSFEAADVTRVGEEEVLRQLSVIENEPGCTAGACHRTDAGKSVLGVLDVEMSMLPLEDALDSAKRQLFGTTLALILIIGMVATAMFRRLILQPVGRLQQGARHIAGGDLSTRIRVSGGHELALLAQDFNRMAEDLSLAKKELTDWSQTLEEKVIEKTAELQDAQVQVQHMEKMASLGKLSATVAHELNNPISGVLTYARLIQRELDEQPLDESVREEINRYLTLVQRESTRCGDIVKNLLLFSRRTSVVVAPIDLNDIVDRSLMLVRHHLDISGVALEVDSLEGESEIVADAGQLQQALVALFVNAAEAMSGGGKLMIRLRGDLERVEIEVSDTGVGIPPDALRHIFEPFYSTKEKENGVGLGLAVVFGIVHRHGGTIDVESEIGQGTTFRIRLPRKCAEQTW